MSHESLEQVERQIAVMPTLRSPSQLRGATLTDVQRELKAARWDQRLAQAAAVLLFLGVGMNAVMGLRSDGPSGGKLAQDRQPASRGSLVDTAVIVAEATDATTARLFARQMAAMTGRKLSDGEAAAIDAAVRRPTPRKTSENEG